MVSIEKAFKDLYIHFPFFAILCSNMNKVYTEEIETLAVGPKGLQLQLYINRKFWDSLPKDSDRYGILLHELYHVAFCHVTDPQYKAKHIQQELMNIAMDCAINQYIEESPGHFATLPEQVITLQKVSQMCGQNLEPKKGCWYYYYNILKAAQKQGGGGSGQGQNGQNSFQMPKGVGSHDKWPQDSNTSKVMQEMQQETNKTALENAQQACKSRGNIPGELKAFLEELLAVPPAVFNWKAYFRRQLGFSSNPYIKRTHKKESRRIPDMPGLKTKFKTKILVGIDTSGSVSDDELKEFIGELHHVMKSGVAVDVCEFDTKLYDTFPLKKQEFKDFRIQGRGGTDFNPILEKYKKEGQYTCLVMFTDGGASVDTKLNKKIIWIISSNGLTKEECQNAHFPGVIINIPKNNK